MYYTIYKITNKIDGKIYIGSHKTKSLNDGYMGSGKYLKRAQEKHGIENFTKEILFVLDSAEEMYLKEAELVNEDFISTTNTYNLKVGGFGGWDYINENNLNGFSNIETAKKGRQSTNAVLLLKYGENWRTILAKKANDRVKEMISNDPEIFKKIAAKRNISGEKNPMYGKSHSDNSKKKMSENKSGKKNSMFGKRWIHSLTEKTSKVICSGEEIPEGWLEGRKIKF
jgi:hypothetical protein